jgi:hypothetical protein
LPQKKPHNTTSLFPYPELTLFYPFYSSKGAVNELEEQAHVSYHKYESSKSSQQWLSSNDTFSLYANDNNKDHAKHFQNHPYNHRLAIQHQ